MNTLYGAINSGCSTKISAEEAHNCHSKAISIYEANVNKCFSTNNNSVNYMPAFHDYNPNDLKHLDDYDDIKMQCINPNYIFDHTATSNPTVSYTIINHSERGAMYKCDMCGFISQSFSQFKVHEFLHTNNLSDICIETYGDMLTDTNNTVYKCKTCKFASNRKHNVKCHMITHQDEKKYECSACTLKFKRKRCFVLHMETHRSNADHTCPLCISYYDNIDSLISHLQHFHSIGKKPRKCYLQPAAFPK